MNSIKLVSEMYQAFSDENLEQLNIICDSNIYWRQNPGFPGGGINQGITNVLENVYQANSKRWESFSFRKDSFSSSGDKVIVQGAYIVRAHGSDEYTEVDTCHIFEIKNDQVASFFQYTDSKSLWDALD